MEITNPPKWLINMPKTDLHCHMGGSIRLTTLLELADKYGIKLPGNDVESIREHVVYKDRPDKSLKSYIDAIKICESVFVRPEVFSRVAYEICKDAHEEKVSILELRFAPTNYNHNGMNLNSIMDATLDGLKRAEKECKMHTGLIVIGMRNDLEASKIAAELAVNYMRKGAVGFDIAGPERRYRPKRLMKAITPVLENLMPVTNHSGEETGADYIKESLVYLNAKRIGHAISLRENPMIMESLDTDRIALEIMVSSNYDTGNIACYETHPAKAYFDYGLRLAVCTDNRTVSDTTVTEEYMILMNHLGFSKKDILKLGRDSIKAAFIHNTLRRQLLNEFDAYCLKHKVKLF